MSLKIYIVEVFVPVRKTLLAVVDNVRPLSGRGGARATLDRQSGTSTPRSAPAAGYAGSRLAA